MIDMSVSRTGGTRTGSPQSYFVGLGAVRLQPPNPRQAGATIKTNPNFPTQVGMTRDDEGNEGIYSQFPHASGDDPSVGVGGGCHPDPFPTLVGVTQSSKEAASGLLVSPSRWGSAHEDRKGGGNPLMGSLPCLV